MRCKFFFCLSIVFCFLNFNSDKVQACESCVIQGVGQTLPLEKNSLKKPWFFDFTFEQQNWDARPAREAHNLHHDGHHVHNKTHEEFYHFTLGMNMSEELTLLAEVPYVVRNSIEIEDHHRLGEKEESRGIGDLNILATYRFLRRGENHLGAIGGIKFPTGETKATNSQGARFEPELQPGTGSYDYPLGVTYQLQAKPFVLRGNALYILKTGGDQDFEFGDIFSTSLLVDYTVNPGSPTLETNVGLRLNFQHEDKQIDHGTEVADSGGTVLFVGPNMSLKASESVSIFGNILFPVHQNPNGMHQELDFVWSAGARISW